MISDTWYFGYGPRFDDKALKALPAGSFYTEPPSQPHFAQTRAEPVVLHITGHGPTDTTYADSALDPRAKVSLLARQSGFPEIPRTLVVLRGFFGLFRIQVGDLVAAELYRLELQPRIQVEVVGLTHHEVQ